MKNKVKWRAVNWVARHPETDPWKDEDLAQHLKNIGIYSPKTYVRDIRIHRVRIAALQRRLERAQVQGR